jgi:hypothetical protein
VSSLGLQNGIVDEHAGIISSDLWDLTGAYSSVVMTKDGTFILTRDPTTGFWSMNRPHSEIPYCKTITNLDGQLVAGSLLPWGSLTSVDSNFVAWSGIGDWNFSLGLKNTAGYRRTSFDDGVMLVRKLRNFCMVYGYNGVARLIPTVDPVATFAYDDVSSVGVFSKSAVACGLQEHVYVGSDGYVYRVTTEGAKQVGYREFMRQLGYNFLATYNPIEGDSYFSDGQKTFVLTPTGLTQIDQHVMSLSVVNGSAVGLFTGSTTGEFLAVTDTIDFSYRGQKTISSVEVGCEGLGDFSVAVDWRMSSSEAFQRTSWVQLNNLQQAVVPIAGNEFRLCLKCSTFEGVKVSYIKVRFKMTDLRGLRGVYAPPPRGQ